MLVSDHNLKERLLESSPGWSDKGDRLAFEEIRNIRKHSFYDDRILPNCGLSSILISICSSPLTVDFRSAYRTQEDYQASSTARLVTWSLGLAAGPSTTWPIVRYLCSSANTLFIVISLSQVEPMSLE